MKKALVFVILAGLFAGLCFAQQGGNVEKGIIGTWNDERVGTWVFSADGKATINGKEGKFGVTDEILSIVGNVDLPGMWNVSMSSDGKTLILNYGNGKGYWLTKQ